MIYGLRASLKRESTTKTWRQAICMVEESTMGANKKSFVEYHQHDCVDIINNYWMKLSMIRIIKTKAVLSAEAVTAM